MHRYTRDARRRDTRPQRVHLDVNPHYGDEFDEAIAEPGHLTVNPVREFTPKVPQSFDELVDRKMPISLANQLGPLIEGAEPVITDSKSFESYLAAFDKRSNSQPADDDDCTLDFQKLALGVWDAVKPFEEWDVDETATERWLAKFDPPKRARMEKAMLELFECEDDPGYLGEKTLSVKVEALLKRYDGKWAPRLIYAGNDHFNALTGPVAMLLCEKLKVLTERESLGPIRFKFAYKEGGPELARHLAEGPAQGFHHCAEGDFSANDLRQRKFATKLCDRAFAKLGCPPWARKLFRDMRKFTVKNLDHGHRAQLCNQLPTGTTLTTPRNTIWNMTIEASYAIVTGNSGVGDVLGDDFLGMLKLRVDCDHWSEWVERETRMKLTGATPCLQGEATFLSRRLHVETDAPCMMPKLGKALARFNARASPNQAITDSQYMAGKALSYAYEFRHFPVFRDLFMSRFEAEDAAKIDLSDISYYTRINGVDSVEALKSSILSETLVVSEDETREFLMDSYGDTFGLVAAREIAERIILCSDPALVSCPDELCIDF